MGSLLDKLKQAAGVVGQDTTNAVRAVTTAPVQTAQRVANQINPLDGGRTFKQLTSTQPNASLIQQATHSGVSNLAGGIVKPLIRSSMALNQGIGNAEIGIAHQFGLAPKIKTQNASQYVQSSIGNNLNRVVDYQGTKRQIAGDAISNVANIAAPSSSKALEAGVTRIAPKVIPKIIPKVASSAAVGAPVGAVSNVGSYLSSNEPVTSKGLSNAAKTGAAYGALTGAAVPAAGAVSHAAVQTARELTPQARSALYNVASRNVPTKQMRISDLVSHEGAPDRARVEQYKQLIQRGNVQTPPLIVVKDKAGQLGVEDGKHRLQAYKELGYTHVPAKQTKIKDITKVLDQRGYAKIPFSGEGDIPGGLSTSSKINIDTPTRASDAAQTSTRQIDSNLALPTSIAPNAEERVFANNPMNSNLDRQGFSKNPKQIDLQRNANQGQLPVAKTELQASGSSTNPLPIYNTKNVSNLDKAFRSTRSIIERQGEAGKQLGGMLQGARDTQETYLALLQKQMPTVREIAKGGPFKVNNKDFENFVDATQGLAKPNNPQVAKAVAEWQATHPQIRDRAIAAGLDVGDLGPTYYPHFIDYETIFKDQNLKNKAINHLIESGQAQDVADATRLLSYAKDVSRNRQFGNLEASRLIDLPMYDKTPNSLISYLNGSAKRIAQTETFGKSDEKALDLIAKATQQGYDNEAMKNAYDVAVGAKQYSPTASKVSGAIRKYVTTTRLGLGALTNVSQNVNTGIVTGHLRTLGAAVKQLDPKTRSFVEDTGVISDAVLNDLKTQQGYSSFSSKVLGKAINNITAPGFGAVEKTNRAIAATAGRDYALRLAQKGDESTLRKLGVTGDIKDKTLNEAQQIQAARKIVEKTQFKVDAQDLPGWTDSPGGKLVSQFRTFSYAQGKFVSNEIMKPAAHGNLLPLSRLLAALPLGYGLYEAKRVIGGRPEEENKAKRGQQAFQNVGGAGLAFDLYQSLNPLGSKYIPTDRRTSMAVGAFAGPAVGVATQGIGALSELVQRKNTPSDESRLDGKLALGKTPDSYTDATPLARFGLQQIPVVGTPIKNRLLPFQKESNADAGKSGGSTASVSSTTDKFNPESAFTTPEAKKFFALKADQQKELARSNPDYQALLDQKAAVATGMKQHDKTTNIPADLAKTVDKYNRLTTDAKRSMINNDPKAEYALAVAKYANDKRDGKLNTVQDIKARANIDKLNAGKEFDKDTRDIYSLSKQQIADLVSQPGGQAIYDKLKAYDQKLLDSHFISASKFKNGLATIGSGKKSTTYKSNLGSAITAAKTAADKAAGAKVTTALKPRKIELKQPKGIKA